MTFGNNNMNAKLKSLGVNRCRKRVKKYLDVQRKKKGSNFSLSSVSRIPLVSIVERLWLVFVAALLLAPLYFIRDVWWLYILLLPPALLFLWKGVAGTYIDVSEVNDASDGEIGISEATLIEKAGDIIATREASYFAVNVLLMIALAVIEVAVAVISALAIAMAALFGA